MKEIKIGFLEDIAEEPIIVQKAIIEALGWVVTKWIDAMWACESPIEKALYPALITEMRHYELYLPQIIPQYEIKSNDGKVIRRADFVIIVEKGTPDEMRFDIECDSHQYHDTNPKQIKKDRRVDAELLALGYQTIRVNGVDINEDVFAVAGKIGDTIFECLYEQYQRKNGYWKYQK